jgi:glycosyltransferase involved in cell wall biosynthesis
LYAARPDEVVAVGTPPLTILHVTAPAAVGGLERVVETLATGHARTGHHVHVAAVIGPDDPEPGLAAAVRVAGATAHVFRVGSRGYLAERAFVRDLCRRYRPDVVHTHGFRSDVVDGGVARRLGIPIVTTVHGFTRNRGRGSLYEWLQRRSFNRFDAVVAVSAAQTSELQAAGVPASRLTVVRNAWSGADDRFDRAAARAALSIPLDQPHLGWVGRLSPEKGADLFLEALARCPDESLHASIIGDGRLRAALEVQAKTLGIAGRVRFCGQLKDAHRYFAAFDVFVMSSHTEGAPIVLFEAFAAGVPVVATAVGGIPEIAGRGEATLVRAHDPQALADAIAALLADPARAAMQVERARLTLRSDYSADRWLATYEALYRRLAGRTVHQRETVS